MRSTRILVSALAVAGVFASGYLIAQDKPTTPAQDRAVDIWTAPYREANRFIAVMRQDHGKDDVDAVTRRFYMAEAPAHRQSMERLRVGAADPDTAREIAFWIIRDYRENQQVPKPRSTADLQGEASIQLQAFQVAQNARIIELLEKIAAKK